MGGDLVLSNALPKFRKKIFLFIQDHISAIPNLLCKYTFCFQELIED